MPARPEQCIMSSMLALASSSVSVFLGWVSHDLLGYSWSDIRDAALTGAIVVGMAYMSAFWRKAAK
jgi:hypothetical protein